MPEARCRRAEGGGADRSYHRARVLVDVLPDARGTAYRSTGSILDSRRHGSDGHSVWYLYLGYAEFCRGRLDAAIEQLKRAIVSGYPAYVTYAVLAGAMSATIPAPSSMNTECCFRAADLLGFASAALPTSSE